jgi:hypothetical protein
LLAKESLTILFGELPPFGKRSLGLRMCGDELRIVLTTAE